MRQVFVTAVIVTAVFLAGGAWSPQLGWQAALLSAAQLAPLLGRHRWPSAALALVAAATVARLLLAPHNNLVYLPVLVALYGVAGVVRTELCLLVVAAVAAAVFPSKGLLDGSVLAASTGILAWLLGLERWRQFAERTDRVARRLHDTLARSTAVMLVQAEALRAAGELNETDRQRVDTLLSAGRGALTLVRRTLTSLHEDHEEPPDLPEVLARLRTAGLLLDRDPDLTALPRPVRTLAERVVAEAAANALRHNGAGVRLQVEVCEGDDLVTVTVRNAAKVSTARPGFGLSGLAAQVRDAGGTIRFGPREGEWLVSATLPMTAAATRSRTGTRAA
ncbi:histidine kinase [Amycolatopsis cynarae]|uniref:histidine kinase n=1 Tax=Amycolatopsis cynarae TaxID=2995223 RepID=A0ABY7B0A1_9PSEU|nr:histidine kinase [Amycolatopsis sp. HUAS 11-8]WAL64884.1 histidine kinase [Amycolatopsis sp. HUAS 11-8]